jgi:hypothetical protein
MTSENVRAELRAWYLAGLWPKLTAAASTGTITSGSASAFDDEMRDLLDLAHESQAEAA